MRIRFGVCADLHADYIHDGADRFEAFVSYGTDSKCDFLIELGDFCPPGGSNLESRKKILDIMKSSSVPIYHTLGNHDMDDNRKGDVLKFIGADRSHYSFDVGEVHFVVLDTCFFLDGEISKSYEYGNYKKAETSISVLPKEILEWLESDLAAAKYPSVLFSHHSLIESRTGIFNTDEVRAVISRAPKGVLLAVCGHEHVDRIEKRDGVYYWCLNSMSYYWAGSRYSHPTYGDPIERDYPILRQVFPYRDPLFAIVEIIDGEIRIEGRESLIIGDSPESLSFEKPGLVDPITASVKDKILRL